MFFLLSHLTGLRIHPDVEVEDEEEEEDSDSEGEEEGEDDEEGEEENDEEEVEGAVIKNVPDCEENEEDDPPVKKMKIDLIFSANENIDSNAQSSVPEQDDVDNDDNDADKSVSGADFSEDDIADAASNSVETDSTSVPSCTVEIRRWHRGCYTLLGDLSASSSSSSSSGGSLSSTSTSLRQLLSTSELDVSLTVFPNADRADGESRRQKWDSRRHGGATIYVAKDEEEELLNIAPKDNSLSLVFREKDTAAFVKYVNSRAPGKFYQIACGYREAEEEMDGVREEDDEEEEDEEVEQAKEA